MTLYVILYHAQLDKTWCSDSINTSREMAEAKLAYERLKQPKWRFELFEIEIPVEVEA